MLMMAQMEDKVFKAWTLQVWDFRVFSDTDVASQVRWSRSIQKSRPGRTKYLGKFLFLLDLGQKPRFGIGLLVCGGNIHGQSIRQAVVMPLSMEVFLDISLKQILQWNLLVVPRRTILHLCCDCCDCSLSCPACQASGPTLDQSQTLLDMSEPSALYKETPVSRPIFVYNCGDAILHGIQS